MRVNCEAQQAWQLCLLLYTSTRDEPARAMTGLLLCGACAYEAKLNDVIGHEAWEQICKEAFLDRGLPKPIKKLTKLVLTRIE